MAEGGSIQEGFLCPVCHRDLRSPHNLITHFQDLHSEEQDILKSIKDLYGKAKKKILKLDEKDLELFKNEISLDNNACLEYSEAQDPGCTYSHTAYFREIRRERLDHRTSETNKLIIRLDKLLRFYGSDKKQQEQYLVEWLDGTSVTRCPSCASSFNLTRRQHHCRLCGGIMCHSCSYFLSYEIAQTLVAPVHNTTVTSEVVSGKESETLRICVHCFDMVETRRKVQIEQMIQPILCQLYNHLQNLKSQIQSQIELYLKMHDSLKVGELTFQLQDAQSLRASIAQKGQMMDTLSKKIANIPEEDSAPKAVSLQNSIRRATSNYIKDYLISLPPLPTLQELENERTNRSKKFEREAQEISSSAAITKIKKVTVTTGWSPSSFESTVQPEDDPIIEQMNIVRNYIDQARKAHRYEEVASLEENLKMLKLTYRKAQQATPSNY